MEVEGGLGRRARTSEDARGRCRGWGGARDARARVLARDARAIAARGRDERREGWETDECGRGF